MPKLNQIQLFILKSIAVLIDNAHEELCIKAAQLSADATSHNLFGHFEPDDLNQVFVHLRNAYNETQKAQEAFNDAMQQFDVVRTRHDYSKVVTVNLHQRPERREVQDA